MPLARGLTKSCERKTRYWTKAAADKAARDRLESPIETPEKLFSYKCPRCGKWHLTKLEPPA